MAKRILGIDPGFGRMGWGVIAQDGSDWRYIAHGCVETNTKNSFIERVQELHNELKAVIEKYEPSHSAVEDLFFAKNAKTAMKVGQARGVILLTLIEAGLGIDEYTPAEIKQAVTGYGNADKEQVQKMLQMRLQLKEYPKQDDAADALAVAFSCGLHSNQHK